VRRRREGVSDGGKKEDEENSRRERKGVAPFPASRQEAGEKRSRK
jgi:hypothetical protein